MSSSSSPKIYELSPTQDWFSFNEAHWKELFKVVKSSTPRVLEIGTWEGRSAVFLANNLCAKGGSITCIDHFDLGHTEAGIERLRKVTSNLAQTGKPHRILKMFSFPALSLLLEEELALEPDKQGYDWIYIDGSHEADDTFLDGELSWRLSKKGTVIIFDDYHWDAQPETSIHHPKKGIDAFLQLHAAEYEQLSPPGAYQMVLRKTNEMRIGFLTPSTPAVNVTSRDFGYRMNVAIAANSQYAMGASVVLHSLADHTPGPITVYIIDGGLNETERERLQYVANLDDHDITIVFLQLPKDSLATELGAMWMQIDTLSLIPAERALYLDSDTLLRGNLRPLWETDLEDYDLGAICDVGFPLGTDGQSATAYFNAGVLLLNLKNIRTEIEGLKQRCREMTCTRFHGQDALNAHFVGRWKALDLVWNAQGLGTYANNISPSRDMMDLTEMKRSPQIVHFTGPIHPSMAEVLNPYVQPYTAKPWGYAGAPGNPFAAEWKAVLNQTRWASYFASEGFRRELKDREEEIIAIGIGEFKKRVENSETQHS